MLAGVRRWGLGWIVVACIGLAISSGCGSGTPASAGAAGSHGGKDGAGVAGASGDAGTGDQAGTTGAAGDQGGATGAAGDQAGGAGGGDASADVRATPSDAGAGDAACGPMRLDRVAPDLLLLLDRSGSMTNQLDGTTCPLGATCVTRWNEVTKAVNQVVKETEGSVRWGLKYFADNNACAVNSGVAVPLGPTSAKAIEESIAATPPTGQTPTRLAVTSAAEYLQTLVDPNPRFLLLATDGLPNCAPGQARNSDDSAGAVQAVKQLADSGVPVYVIGIGLEPTAIATLEQLAMAGGRPRAGFPVYYPVGGSADLVDALHAIGAQTMPCTYALPAVPASPQEVVIKAANAVIPRDPTHANGWDFEAAMKSVRLYGSWCTKDQAGMLENIQVSAPCP